MPPQPPTGTEGPDLPPFVAPRWLKGPHAQTLGGRLLRDRPEQPGTLEPFGLSDGDEVLLDRLDAGLSPDAPRVLLVHGLGGDSTSGYVRGTAAALRAAGLRPIAMNCRGALRPNRGASLYHAGAWGDVHEVLTSLAAEGPPVGIVGFSLGGSMTLNALARTGEACPAAAAAVVSVPLDLSRGVRVLERGLGPLYARYLLVGLRRLLSHRPDLANRYDAEAAARARTVRAFDEAVVAPLHGFRDAEHYYAESSAGPRLGGLRRPVLMLRAVDDPFLDPDDLRYLPARGLSALVSTEGGHVGFVAGSPRRPRFWMEETLARWMAARLGAPIHRSLP